MRIITFLALILIYTNFFSQSSQVDINWVGDEQYNIANKSLIVPKSKDFKNNYSYGDYYRIVKQWESDRIIDESSVEVSNIIYSDIDLSEFNGLENINFPKEASFKFNSSISKNLIFSFLELDPIIFDNGKHKKVESFVITHRYSEKSKNNKNLIQDTLEGKFGDIISVNLILAHGNSPGMEKSWKLNPKYSGGGCLLDPGIHLIDIGMLLSKNSIKLKSYLDWRGFWNTGIEEEILFLAKDASNTIYNFNISLNRWRSEFKIQVNGTDGYGIVTGRGRSYGNQKYVTGKRWGWSDSKTQSESEEVIVNNYAANEEDIKFFKE